MSLYRDLPAQDLGPLFRARTYPQHPGAKEKGSTSEQAARAVDSEARTLRSACVGALRRHGARSSDEVAQILGKSVLAIRPRLSELRRLALIEPAGERVQNASGMSAKRWRVVA
jgi:hypothetical protein